MGIPFWIDRPYALDRALSRLLGEPKANVLGEPGRGYKVAIETLNEGRIGIGAQMIGVARAALDAAIGYSKERRQFGKPICEHQSIQF